VTKNSKREIRFFPVCGEAARGYSCPGRCKDSRDAVRYWTEIPYVGVEPSRKFAPVLREPSYRRMVFFPRWRGKKKWLPHMTAAVFGTILVWTKDILHESRGGCSRSRNAFTDQFSAPITRSGYPCPYQVIVPKHGAYVRRALFSRAILEKRPFSVRWFPETGANFRTVRRRRMVFLSNI